MQGFHRTAFRSRHILSSASRSAGALSFAALSGTAKRPLGRRCIHEVQTLPYKIEKGLGNFLSPQALKILAEDYQKGLLDRLSDQVKGTIMASQSVTDTVISTAQHKELAVAFNYASQALNNSFFLNGLTPPPETDEDAVGSFMKTPRTNEDALGNYSNLMVGIRESFGDLTKLKDTFSAAAMGMVSSGWVWLVSDEFGNMQVVATFGAGTLLVRSRAQFGWQELPILGEPLDSKYKGKTVPGSSRKTSPLNRPSPFTPSFPTSGLGVPPTMPTPPEHSRTFHLSSIRAQMDIPTSLLDRTPSGQISARKTQEIGEMMMPMLCVSVHEHAWMAGGYGIWGKEEYLKRFWTVVDWKKVDSAYGLAVKRVSNSY
ncbi:hypothetical protein M422DRAFT_197564 [Sphaerobolus stellatus SS14]|nr:hypothetical protein M422DRAFT_197564 [Sphaerobolus stellatus SS14]